MMRGPIHRLLIVFAKLPESGTTKTRLARGIGSEAAAELYAAFLDDTIAAAREIPADRELRVVPHPRARSVLAARYPDFRVREQEGDDLGARLRGAFADAFGSGVHHVLITGSDHPTLPPDYLRRGLDSLNAAHLVLGPAEDGGYYAIALRRSAWPAARGLFDGVPWSSGGVLSATRRRARELGLCHVELPEWYDVDEPERLVELGRAARAGSRTAAVLARLGGAPAS